MTKLVSCPRCDDLTPVFSVVEDFPAPPGCPLCNDTRFVRVYLAAAYRLCCDAKHFLLYEDLVKLREEVGE